MKVLVVYFTKTGSTREASESLAGALRERGVDALALPGSGNPDPAGYDLVVIGAPIHGMQWLPEATDYISRRSAALGTVRTAYFCLSYIYPVGRPFWRKAVEKAFLPASKIVPPAKTAIFGGRVEESMPAFARFIFGIPGTAGPDQTDRDAVLAWAAELAGIAG